MVMRCTRLSRYSAVISPADSSRSPLVILPIIVCSRLLMARPPSRSFHHANGLALRARDRPRREQRDLDVQSQRGPQPRRHLAPEPADFRVIGLDAAASLQERRPPPGPRGPPVVGWTVSGRKWPWAMRRPSRASRWRETPGPMISLSA